MELDPENNVAFAQSAQPKRKKITHIWWTTVFCIFKAYPLAFGLVDMFFSLELILAQIRYHSYIVDGKQYYLYEYGNPVDRNKCEVALFWLLEAASIVYYLGLTIGYAFSPLSYARLPLTIIGFVIYLVQFIRFCCCIVYRTRKLKADKKKAKTEQQFSNPAYQGMSRAPTQPQTPYGAYNPNDDLYRWD